MATHKIRPKVKKFKKFFIDSTFNKKFFYPVETQYISTKFSEKISQDYNSKLQNLRKFKYLYKFSKTSTLKNLIKKQKKKNSWSFLKEKELFSLFENRLDLILYRLNLVSSLFEAKQLISHGKVYVNGKINRNYSYSLTKGNIISFKKSTEATFKDRLLFSFKNVNFYSYDNLEVCYKTFKIIILTEKIDSKKYLQHYSYFLNWSNLLIG